MTTLPTTEQIQLELDQGWLTIWLNRPESRNALTEQMTDELLTTLAAVQEDRTVRGISVTGRGECFCAGGDIKGFKSIFQGKANAESVARASRRAGQLFNALAQAPQVVLMLIDGAAMAGGMGMACAGDIVIATKRAMFGLTETTLGIPPAQIAPWVVGRLGQTAARRLMLTGQRIDCAAALQIGLVDYAEEDAVAVHRREAQIRSQVMRCAPGANAATKSILAAVNRLETDAMIDFAAEQFTHCMLGEEGLEGVSAFIEKRKPRWQE